MSSCVRSAAAKGVACKEIPYMLIYKGCQYREALPYQTRDPIPGTALKAFEQALTVFKQPLAGLDFIVDAIQRNGDGDWREGRDLIRYTHDSEERLKSAVDKAYDIVRFDPEDRNAYELLKSLSWTSAMLGYLEQNEIETLEAYVGRLRESLSYFFKSMFGADASSSIDSLYTSAGNDIEEYFGGVAAWEHIQQAYTELDRLDAAIKAVHAYARYSKTQYEYARKWQMESSHTRPSKIYPEGVEALEIMWHATTAYNTVLAEGLKTKQQLEAPAGLGGGSSDLISFTASFPHAEGIRDAMLDMAKMMRGPQTFEAADSYRQELGLSDKGWQWVLDTFEMNWASKVKERFGYLVEYILTKAQEEGLRYNPVFFGADLRERFAKLDPNQIELVEAIVDTTSEETTYHRAEEEWRIPPENVLSLGPVGSQQTVLEQLQA